MKKYEIKTPVTACTWDELSEEQRALLTVAKNQTEHSYCPYSGFHVGAALELKNGIVVPGCNQENAAYPSGLCAERTALFAAGAQYPDQPVMTLAITARNTKGELIDEPASPCGTCRQVIIETEKRFKQPVRILLYGKKHTYVINGIKQLMPLSFTEF